MDNASLLKLLGRATDALNAAHGSVANGGQTPAAMTSITAAYDILSYVVTKLALTGAMPTDRALDHSMPHHD